MTRAGWRGVLVLVGVFALGGVAGGFVTRAVSHRHFAHRFSGAPDQAREQFLIEAMTRRLDLSDEQAGRIRGILGAHAEERRAIFQQCRPAHEQLKARVDAEVEAVLTPEQRTLYAEFKQRRERRRRH